MRYVWTVVGDDHDFSIGDKHGINGYFLPMFDQALTTRGALQEVKNRGYAAGLYLGHRWLEGKSPDEIAKLCSDEYARCFVPGLKVQFNFEEHDPEFIAATLEAWRNLRRTVNTSWTMEPMQGGWMSTSFRDRILACRVRVVPQGFAGAMQRFAEDVVLRDLLKRGFPENLINLFYDAAALPRDWDGWAFTMGRLP